jgi:ribosome-binding factor A
MSQRVTKVQNLMKEVLGERIQNLKDPRVGFATVTAVRVSADLRHARVFVSVLGDEKERRSTIAGLKSATSLLRAEIGRQMRMKYTPELEFELDTIPEQAQHLEELLREVRERSEGEAR